MCSQCVLSTSMVAMKEGSLTVTKTKCSSAPVLVNLFNQENQCNGKTRCPKRGKLKVKRDEVKTKKVYIDSSTVTMVGTSQWRSLSSPLYLWRWTLMKNKTRRPMLIFNSAPKQSQRGHLETKVEADSPFTASQHPTPLQP